MCITIPKHIEGILEAVSDDMGGIDKTPAANHLLQVQ